MIRVRLFYSASVVVSLAFVFAPLVTTGYFPVGAALARLFLCLPVLVPPGMLVRPWTRHAVTVGLCVGLLVAALFAFALVLFPFGVGGDDTFPFAEAIALGAYTVIVVMYLVTLRRRSRASMQNA